MSRPLRPTDLAPDDLDLPFWEACDEHRFLLHVCDRCGRAYWPATCCLEHGFEPMAWQSASGAGVVHTFTVYHHPYSAELAERTPYVVAVIALAEGPFMHADVIDVDPSEVHVGMAVEICFEDLDGDGTVPHFRPSSETGSGRGR